VTSEWLDRCEQLHQLVSTMEFVPEVVSGVRHGTPSLDSSESARPHRPESEDKAHEPCLHRHRHDDNDDDGDDDGDDDDDDDDDDCDRVQPATSPAKHQVRAVLPSSAPQLGQLIS
jgi:hypothetical protein